MNQLFPITALMVLIMPYEASAEVFFHEDFESGSSPFSFSQDNSDRYDPNPYFTGELVTVPGERHRVWRNTFHNYCNDSYFGLGVTQQPQWRITNKIHWRAYVKFGDTDNAPEWATTAGTPGCYYNDSQRSYELKFPDIGGGNGLDNGRIIGKIRAFGSDQRGVFRLYTPDGSNHNHTDQGAGPFVSNRWYAIEFMVEDNGNNDTVKIWINNNNPDDPDYIFTGGNMFDSSQWSAGIYHNHGYKNHNSPSDRNFYFDDIAIGNSFIGTDGGLFVLPNPPGIQ